MPETEKIRVYFLASGEIAIPLLDALMQSKRLELVGLASQFKEFKGTGPVRSVKSPLVRNCEKHGIDISRFASVNSEEFHEAFRKSGAELLIVASYGQILKPALLELPKFGCLNIHASLLPKYRGAAPIVAALLNGDKKTGVSFMRMEAGLDTGPIYSVAELEISPKDRAVELEDKLGKLAGERIDDVVEGIVRRGLQPVPQSEEGASYAGKVSKEEGFIDWNWDAYEIANKIRAYTPRPGVPVRMPLCNGTEKNVKLTLAEGKDIDEGTPGEILKVGRDGFLVSCGKGALLITKLTPEGKRDMDVSDYILGNPYPQEHGFIYSLR